MENNASINYRSNFIWSLKNTLERYLAADSSKKTAILDHQTVQGVRWAISFMKSLDHECMTEAELNHAIRLTYFRGQSYPAFNG